MNGIGPAGERKKARRGEGEVFTIASVFLALNDNTIIFPALQFSRNQATRRR